MDDFERGFNEELEKIAQGVQGLMRQYGVRPEHLIGAGIGATAGGVGGYYGGKALTDSQAGGAAGAALGALGGGALGAAGGHYVGKALRVPAAHGPRRELDVGKPTSAYMEPGTIAPPEGAGGRDMSMGMRRWSMPSDIPDNTPVDPDMTISLEDVQQYAKGLKKKPKPKVAPPVPAAPDMTISPSELFLAGGKPLHPGMSPLRPGVTPV